MRSYRSFFFSECRNRHAIFKPLYFLLDVAFLVPKCWSGKFNNFFSVENHFGTDHCGCAFLQNWLPVCALVRFPTGGTKKILVAKRHSDCPPCRRKRSLRQFRGLRNEISYLCRKAVWIKIEPTRHLHRQSKVWVWKCSSVLCLWIAQRSFVLVVCDYRMYITNVKRTLVEMKQTRVKRKRILPGNS